MPFLHLILAHLLGDFVLQSNTLIKKKYESWVGTLVHVLIVTAITALLIFPYLHHLNAWLVLGFIGLTHFGEDLFKVWFDKHYNKDKSPLPFFFDQAVHLAVIFASVPYISGLELMQLPNWIETLYQSDLLILALIGVVLISYTLDITYFQFKRRAHAKKHKKSKKDIAYHPDNRGMLVRVLAFAIFYLLFYLSGLNITS